MVVIVAIAISSIITLTSSSSSFCFFTTPITTPHLSNSLAPLFDKIRIFDSYGHIVNVKHAYNKHKATHKDVVRTRTGVSSLSLFIHATWQKVRNKDR